MALGAALQAWSTYIAGHARGADSAAGPLAQGSAAARQPSTAEHLVLYARELAAVRRHPQTRRWAPVRLLWPASLQRLSVPASSHGLLAAV